jgi:hypothetical protein
MQSALRREYSKMALLKTHILFLCFFANGDINRRLYDVLSCVQWRGAKRHQIKKKLFLTQNNFAIFESLPFLLEKGRNFFRKKIEIKILDTASFFSI